MALAGSRAPLGVLTRALSRSKSLCQLSDTCGLLGGQEARNVAAVPARLHDSDSESDSAASIPNLAHRHCSPSQQTKQRGWQIERQPDGRADQSRYAGPAHNGGPTSTSGRNHSSHDSGQHRWLQFKARSPSSPRKPPQTDNHALHSRERWVQTPPRSHQERQRPDLRPPADNRAHFRQDPREQDFWSKPRGNDGRGLNRGNQQESIDQEFWSRPQPQADAPLQEGGKNRGQFRQDPSEQEFWSKPQSDDRQEDRDLNSSISGAALKRKILRERKLARILANHPNGADISPRPENEPKQKETVASLSTNSQAGTPQSSRETQIPKAKEKPRLQSTGNEEIMLPDEVNLKILGKSLGIDLQQAEATLTELGLTISSDQDLLSPSDAELIAMSHGKLVTFSKAVLERNNDALPRPPVVTIMGHVDHGKTSLLDALRKSSVAAGEAGGITQHIGAFQVTMPDSGGMITFLDTPGHAAFSSMRARGAAVTDLVVLVCAADDGVMPQTREAIAHAQASGCPIVVALTKCDLPGADVESATQQLAEEGLELDSFGGTIPVVQTAAPKGIGLTELEEALLFQAELLELKASRTRPVVGTVVEAKMTKGQGPVATIIVKRGTLKVGQNVVVGSHWGKVRVLKSATNKMLKEALPGQPVEVSGLRGMPMAGNDFLVQPSEESARQLAEARQLKKEQLLIQSTAHDSSTASSSSTEADAEDLPPQEKQLVVLIKADTQGSAEAIAASLEALSSEIVSVKPVQAGLGAITTSDIDMAISTNAKVVGFNVKPACAAVDSQAKQKDIQIVKHNIIYHLLQEASAWMAELAPQVEEEVTAGEANIVQTFPLKERRGQEGGTIAGCRCHTGSLSKQSTFRVLRSGEQIWEGKCSSIRRHKLEVQQVGKGTECGVLLEGFTGFQPGDVLRCIQTRLVAQPIENVCTVLHSGKTQTKNSKYAAQN